MSYTPTSLIHFLSNDGNISISVKLDMKEDTVWLNLNQIAQLFERDKSVISKHLKNIFLTEELNKNSVVAFFATTASDGKSYNVEYFNLDAILSVGYRVNSKKGTAFRKWASKVLKEHLIKGFSLHKDKLREEGLHELEKTLTLLKQTLLSQKHITNIGAAALDIVNSYTRTWALLNAFDEDRLPYPELASHEDIVLSFEHVSAGIFELKKELLDQKEASQFFGRERDEAFHQVWGTIHQTFSGSFLYPSLYERAAHLFYFTIKDHPFVDGNKRIASFLLIFYLATHELTIPLRNEGLVALTLLIAQSNPQDKDIMIKLILNLFEGETLCL